MKRFILGLAAVALLLAGPARARAGGGKVLPATATPLGYSLQDMAEAMAYFNTSYNDLDFYPDTPFQILYLADPNTDTTNTFTVNTGTKFFVPVFWVDDSMPIIGDFPDDKDDIAHYVFGRKQLGAHDLEIVVDGEATTLGAAYAAGATLPFLLDGDGKHIIQVGAFLTPLSKGIHTVTIQGTLDGDAILDVLGGPYSIEATYTVNVKD